MIFCCNLIERILDKQASLLVFSKLWLGKLWLKTLNFASNQWLHKQPQQQKSPKKSQQNNKIW